MQGVDDRSFPCVNTLASQKRNWLKSRGLQRRRNEMIVLPQRGTVIPSELPMPPQRVSMHNAVLLEM